MKKLTLTAAALLAAAVPALGHTANLSADCTTARLAYTQFPTWRDSTLTYRVLADGSVLNTGTQVVRGSGTILVPFVPALTGARALRVELSWVSDTNGSAARDMALNCPVPVPPTTPESPVTPPPPVVPPAPPIEVPTDPVPPTPPVNKPKPSCQDLILARAGENTLRKRGCKVTRLPNCAAGKIRVVLKGGRIVCRPGRPVRVAG